MTFDKIPNRDPGHDRYTRLGRALLASGLSIARMNSFRRQLELLGRALGKLGVPSVLVGRRPSCRGTQGPTRDGSDSTGPGSEPPEAIGDIPGVDGRSLRELAARHGVRHVVLLGYVDQFPILKESSPDRANIYLWAQVSHPPSAAVPHVVAIPLTPRTGHYLSIAGFRLGECIPHAVDTVLYRPKDAGGSQVRKPPRGTVSFLSVGANTTRKRFDRLTAAFVRTRDELLSRGVQCSLTVKTDRVVGGFDLDRLARQARDVSVMTSELTDTEMASLYRDHDVYVHAAEWEGFGIPVIEAMACGLPVVCPDSMGPGEIVPYNELLAECDPGPPDVPQAVRSVRVTSLSDRMIAVATNPELRSRLGAKGVAAARKEFDADVVARRWVACFQRRRYAS